MTAPARLGPAAAARRAQLGQASIELIGLLPVVIAIGLAFLQLLATGYAKVLAASAAEAGALALAAGGDARAGVREALPGWSRARAQVFVRADEVEVRVEPPSPLNGLAERLEVSGQAAVEAP
jgi:pilus assembly protein CpaE